MSKRFKEKVGDELYNQILEKGIKESDFDLLEGYIPRQRYNEISDKFKASEEKNQTYEKQIEETKEMLKESGDYKDKFDELSEKHLKEIEMKDRQISNTLKTSLIKERFSQEGVKHVDLLLKSLNLDEIQLKDDKLFGFDDTVKSLKESYDDMFVKVENQQNINSGENGDNSDSNNDFSFLDNIKS